MDREIAVDLATLATVEVDHSMLAIMQMYPLVDRSEAILVLAVHPAMPIIPVEEGWRMGTRTSP